MALIGCQKSKHADISKAEVTSTKKDALPVSNYNEEAGQGALLLTRFKSLEEFKAAVNIQYAADMPVEAGRTQRSPVVQLTYYSAGQELTSLLKSGISQKDFLAARSGSLWDRIRLGMRCPFAFFHRNELKAIESLGRRRPPIFGKGDAAFYDFAETMVKHIREEDRLGLPAADLAEKGYLNTFNHITAQSFMTSVFSEEVADFIADMHELYNMPELATGQFTEKQLADFENGPVDNYVDMINNEWGQELGKALKEKYSIIEETTWTPELLADYLNDIKSYCSWAFQISFIPFKATDELVIKFAWKINTVLEGGRKTEVRM
jgi:hypothetical protein